MHFSIATIPLLMLLYALTLTDEMSSADLRDADKVDDPLLANPVTQAQPPKVVGGVNFWSVNRLIVFLHSPGRKEAQPRCSYLHLDCSLFECCESTFTVQPCFSV